MGSLSGVSVQRVSVQGGSVKGISIQRVSVQGRGSLSMGSLSRGPMSRGGVSVHRDLYPVGPVHGLSVWVFLSRRVSICQSLSLVSMFRGSLSRVGSHSRVSVQGGLSMGSLVIYVQEGLYQGPVHGVSVGGSLSRGSLS